jgi:hypothetical protein
MEILLPSNFPVSKVKHQFPTGGPNCEDGKVFYFSHTGFTKPDVRRYSSNCVVIEMEVPEGFPRCNYVINKGNYRFERHGWSYGQGFSVVKGLNEYPYSIKGMIAYLNEPLHEYGDEPRYKILRRYNYLMATFGTVDDRLLHVDCKLLYDTVENCIKTEADGLEATIARLTNPPKADDPLKTAIIKSISDILDTHLGDNLTDRYRELEGKIADLTSELNDLRLKHDALKEKLADNESKKAKLLALIEGI